MAMMGRSSPAMARHYQHVTDPLLKDTARKVHGLFWGGIAPALPVD